MPHVWRDDQVFLTGATGFVGSHVLDALLNAGYGVRALVRPHSRPLPPRDGVSAIAGDLRRPGDVTRAMHGCRYLVHVAALYSFSPDQRSDVRTVNVQGTAGILEAARIAGIERAVVTSSSATVGPARDGRPATEDDWSQADHRGSVYHQSKIDAERAALAAQVPSVLVLPTAPVGPGDWKPTPTGKMVVDFMRGRIVASLAGGLNLVPVEDVARAHVLAMERGRPRERYLIGAENLPLTQVWQMLADVCNRSAPRWRMPYHAALALGWGDEIYSRLRPGRAPLVPLEGVYMARHDMFVTCEKAQRELGFTPSGVPDALARAVGWYRDHGYA